MTATPLAPHVGSEASDVAVRTKELRRVYESGGRRTEALAGVDLEVSRGELFGVLGPNGAGKTTLIKILVTLLAPSQGRAWVDGLDVSRDVRALRSRIAMVSGGENSGYGVLTVREHSWMFSQFYGLSSRSVRPRIDEFLHRLGLWEVRDRRVSELSSGMRQKMNLVRGFITNPRVLFLDEPTVALDVGAARDVRREVRRWMAEDASRSVILTTHYMAEADELCDRIAIVNRGRIIAAGSPIELKGAVAERSAVDLEVSAGDSLLDGLRRLPGVSAASVVAVDGHDNFSLALDDDQVLIGVLAAVKSAGRNLLSLRKREASLEDAFVRLVGRSMSEEEQEGVSPDDA